MAECVHTLGIYKTEAQVTCMAISGDSRLVIAGSKDGHVYFFDRFGHLLAQRDIEGTALRLAIAENLQSLVVWCTGRKKSAYLWDYEGNPQSVYKTPVSILDVRITPNADLVALSSSHLYMFNSSGSLLWRHRLSYYTRRMAITQDGNYIAAISEDHYIYLFDRSGKLCWRSQTGSSLSTDFQIAATVKHVAIVSNGHLHLLDLDGQLVWKNKIGQNINIATLTPDGRYIAAGSITGTVFFFSYIGELLWSSEMRGKLSSLAISTDGRFLLIGTEDKSISLFNEEGDRIWMQKMAEKVCEIVITPGGRLFALALKGHSLHLLENLVASQDFQIDPNQNSKRLVQTITRRIRDAYTTNTYLGLVSWFDKFDRALSLNEFTFCYELLKEVREGGYPLSSQEVTYVDSREGALLLCQGIAFHQAGEYLEARRCYSASQRIHHRLNYLEGEGQAIAALKELNKQSDLKVLGLLASKPRVLGNSSTLLENRIENATLADQLQIIMAAKLTGCFSLLLKALSSNNSFIQATAATALAWLKPGPDSRALLEMLTLPNWVIRWQATLLLQLRARESKYDFAPHLETVRKVVSHRLANDETDPMVRREMVSLMRHIGNAGDTPSLFPLLHDPDADVRFAAVETLAYVGDRRALPKLKHLQDGREFGGKSISELVKVAIEGIEQRYPFKQQKAIFSRELTFHMQSAQPATLFLADEPIIYCIVTILDLPPGSCTTCTVLHEGQILFREEKVVSGPLPSNPLQREVPLVELVAKENTALPSTIVFSLSSSTGKWLLGIHSVQVALDDEVQGEYTFKVISQVVLESSVISSGVDSTGRPINATNSFFTDTPIIYCSVALEEAPIGLEIKGQVYRASEFTLIAENTVKTVIEGKQSVSLSWKPDNWSTGEYRAIITTSLGASTIHHFFIAPSLHIQKQWTELAIQQAQSGQWEEAITTNRMIVKSFPNDFEAYNRLGRAYSELGQNGEVELTLLQVLAMNEQVLGPDHIKVAAILNSLATLNRDMGRYAQALSLYKRALIIYEQELGSDHLEVAAILDNLATLNRNMGRYAQALPLYKRTLIIYEQELGSDHLEVAAIFDNLATLNRNMGRYAQARLYHTQALKVYEQLLGPNHPKVATLLESYASLLREMKQ